MNFLNQILFEPKKLFDNNFEKENERLKQFFTGYKDVTTLDLLLILYKQSGCIIPEDLHRIVNELSDDLIHLKTKFLKYFKHSVTNLVFNINPFKSQIYYDKNAIINNLVQRLGQLLKEKKATIQELKDNDKLKADFIKLFKYSSSHTTHDDYEEINFIRKDLDRLIDHSSSNNYWFVEYNCKKCFEILEKLNGFKLK